MGEWDCLTDSLTRFFTHPLIGCVIDPNEPLIHGAEDDGRLASPAVRVAVMIVFLMQQHLAEAQLVQHRFVGVALTMFFKNGFGQHPGRHLLLDWQVAGMGEPPIVIHRRVNRQPVRHPQVIVFQTMSGSDVDEASAGDVFHEGVPSEKFARPIAERMLIFNLTQVPTIEAADNLIAMPAAFFGDGRQQQRGDDELLATNPGQRVAESRVIRDCQVGRQCPRCRGPNND